MCEYDMNMDESSAPLNDSVDVTAQLQVTSWKNYATNNRKTSFIAAGVLVVLIVVLVVEVPHDSHHRDHHTPLTITVQPSTNYDYSEVAEDSPIGSYVAQVRVNESGSLGARVYCQTVEDNFLLVQVRDHDSEYELVTNAVFDREVQNEYKVLIQCDDLGGRTRRLYTVKHIVKVTDINDCTPQFEQDNYLVEIQENNPPNTHVFNIKAVDRDSGLNGQVRYDLEQEAKKIVQLDAKNGNLVAIVTFDREVKAVYRFQVSATDQGPHSHTTHANVTLVIRDVNDQPPIFLEDKYIFWVRAGVASGTVVGKVEAVDMDEAPYDTTDYLMNTSSKGSQYFEVARLTGAIYTKKVLHTYKDTFQELVVIAINTAPPYSNARVQVWVIVVAENGGAAHSATYSLMLALLALATEYCISREQT